MTKTIFLTGLGTLAILSMILLPYAPQAEAGVTACSVILTSAGGPYNDVIVNPGDSCFVEDGTIINGNFEAIGAVDIFMFGPSITIGGAVEIKESTGNTFVFEVSVGESIKVEKSVAPLGVIFLVDNTVGKDIQVLDNEILRIDIRSNVFNSGDIIVLKNTSSPFDATIFRIISNISPQNILVQDNTLFSSIAAFASASIIVDRNQDVEGNIIVEKNTLNSDTGTRGSTDISIFANTFSSGNIQVQANSLTTTVSGFGARSSATISIDTNSFFGNGQNIIALENSINASTEDDEGGVADSRLLVFGNDIDGNIKVQKNAVNGDGTIESRAIVAVIFINNNQFSSGNLQVQENSATANGPTATTNAVISVVANGDVSPPQNIELQKNTASAPGTKQMFVERNVATDNFQCSENSPAPTGSLNVGNLEGQCTGLT